MQVQTNHSGDQFVPLEYTATHSPFTFSVENRSGGLFYTTEVPKQTNGSVPKVLVADRDLSSMHMMQENEQVFLFEKVEHVLSFLLAVCLIVAVFVLFLFRQRTFLHRVYEKNKYKYQTVQKEIYF
jgi:hypothetical protein